MSSNANPTDAERPLAQVEQPAPGALRLADLQVGEEARVGDYPDSSEYCERLIRMGLIPGTTIRLERRAPLGDPVEIRFRGYALVLRPAEADCLRLEQS